MYRADGMDGPQEMERNLAAARHSWARQHAWLLLNFFPFPVGHPPHPPCKRFTESLVQSFGNRNIAIGDMMIDGIRPAAIVLALHFTLLPLSTD